MKSSKLTFASLAATLLISLTIQAKNEMKKAYVFGLASSFNDSTIYITEVQEVDSAWFVSKKHFLVGRENYSYQLRNHLEDQGEEHRICTVAFSTNEKKIQKTWDKMLAHYTRLKKKKNNQKHITEQAPYVIKYITKEQFHFQAVNPLENDNSDSSSSK